MYLTGANEDHVTSLDWGHPLAFLQPARACEHEEHVLGLFMDVLGELVAGLIPGVVDGDVPSADLARPGDAGAPGSTWIGA